MSADTATLPLPLPHPESDDPSPAPVHIAPKRTYGRAKPVPPPDALPASSSGPITLPVPAAAPSPPASSPSHGLSRFRKSDWRKEMEEESEEEEEVDEVAAYRMVREMEEGRRRAEAAAEAGGLVDEGITSKVSLEVSSSLPPLTSSPGNTTSPAIIIDSDPIPIPIPSSIPTLPSSIEDDEETAPIRRPGTSGTNRRKRLAPVSSEDDSPSSTPRVPKSKSPSTRGLQSSPVSPIAGSSKLTTTHLGRARSPSPYKRKRVSDERAGTPTPMDMDTTIEEPESSPVRLGEGETYIAETIEDPSQSAQKRKRKARSVVGSGSESGSGGEGGGDDYDAGMDVDMGGSGEEEEYGAKGAARKGKMKAPSKKLRMETDLVQAEIRRNKRVEAPIVESEPIKMIDLIASFVGKQKRVLPPKKMVPFHPPTFSFDQQATPTLDHSRTSGTPLSAHHATPTDDIEPFSSVGRQVPGVVIDLDGPSSSPSDSKGLRFVVPSRSAKELKVGKGKGKAKQEDGSSDSSEGEEEPELESLEAVMEKAKAQGRVNQLAEQKRAILAQRKAALPVKKVELSDDEDDFEIIAPPPKPSPLPTALAAKTSVRSRNERTQAVVLDRLKAQPNAARQKVLSFAGPGVAKKQAVTETMFDHAGRQFGHGDKVRAGPHQPPGQKANKKDVITPKQRDLELITAARAQAAALAAQKEKDFGYKPKSMPERTTFDVQALQAAGRQAFDDDVEAQDSDDDPEDIDYNPGGAMDMDVEPKAEVVEEEEEEEEMAYSGEDEGEGSGEEEEDDAGSDTEDESSEKENQPPVGSQQLLMEDKENAPPSQSEEAVVLAGSRRRAGKQRVVVDSDEEMSMPPPPVPLAAAITTFAVHADGEATDGASGGDLSFDLEGGFSQFFGATQAFGGDDQAGFDQLRNDAVPQVDQVRLPEVNISATALAKNAAVMQAELETAIPAEPSMTDKEVPLYLNEQGLFTQTRPKTMLAPAISLGESLADPSEKQQYSGDLLATYQTAGGSDVPGGESLEMGMPSPTLVPAQPVKRKRLVPRRPDPDMEATQASSDHAQPPTDSSTSEVPVATEDGPRDAFKTLMASKGKSAGPRETDEQMAQFMEDQAEESEDEYAFGRRGDEDDNEEDVDQDGELEGLVDHEEMSAEDKERDRLIVMEKEREIAKQDDAAAQQYAQDVVDGKMKGKHRGGGIGLDLSDDDSDEEKKSKRRKRQDRKRIVEGDGFNGMDPNNPFYKTYRTGIDDSDEEDDVVNAEDDFDFDAPRDARVASPAPRTETVNRRQAEQEAVRQMREAAARKAQQAETTRAARYSDMPIEIDSEPIIDLDSDDDSPAGFVLSRNIDQTPKAKAVSTNKFANEKRFATLAADKSEVDSRKSGGISSVQGQQSRKSSTSSISSASTFRTGSQGKKDDRALPRRTSSMASSVLSKKSGFGE